MTLVAGARLGPYEILSAIGAGGMGEVYKARDTRLDRTVAIKVLPAHLADRPLKGPLPLFSYSSESLLLATCYPTTCYSVTPDGQTFFALRMLPRQPARDGNSANPQLDRRVETPRANELTHFKCYGYFSPAEATSRSVLN